MGDLFYDGRVPLWGPIVHGITIFGLLFILANWEHVRVIRRLEQEIDAVQVEVARVEQQRLTMVDFWRRISELTDIWQRRTSPIMELLCEIHVQLAAIKDPMLLMQMLARVNDLMDRVDEIAGGLE